MGARLTLKKDRCIATFDPNGHRYLTKDGRSLISVTQAMGIFTEKVYRFIPREILKAAADRGTAVHLATEYEDQDNLDLDSCLPEWIPYIEAYKKFRAEIKAEILFTEQRLVHPKLFYAGAVDRVLEIDGDYWIVDLKTTGELYEHVGIQLAAYAELLNQNLEKPVKLRRAALQLKNDGSYVFREHTKADDWSAFLACLTLINWNRNHGNAITY